MYSQFLQIGTNICLSDRLNPCKEVSIVAEPYLSMDRTIIPRPLETSPKETFMSLAA